MYVWYSITLRFGLSAREVQVQPKKLDLVIDQDKDGEVITLATGILSKNCQGGIAGHEFQTVGLTN